MIGPARAPTTSVVVIGVAGSGKTTVAHALARRLGWVFAEGDDFHPPANVEKMRTGHPLDDEDRWPWLRSLAGWIGEYETAGRDAILTCSALRHAYRDLLRDGHPSVWFAHLAVPAEVLLGRLAHRPGHYMPASLLPSQLAAVEPLRSNEPGSVIAADADPDVIVERLVEALRAQR